MEFNKIDHHFCEGNILGVPEIFNSFSSLIFSIFGFYGLFNQSNYNLDLVNYSNLFIIHFVYSTFVVIGIGSFGYHWTEQIGWALMDETPMIVSIFFGLLYIEYCNFLLQKLDIIEKKNKQYQFLDFNYKIIITVLINIMFLFITINPLNYYRKLFPILFGVFLILFFYKFINLINTFDKKFNKNIISYGKSQLLIISIAAIIWCFTEIVCKYNKNYLLLIGHPLWHIFMAYGFYNIIQIIYFISLFIQTYNIKNIFLENFDIFLCYNNFYILNIKNTY